jgi:hypothetical protein
MSTLQVANIHLESTGNNRIHVTSANTITIAAGGVNTLVINSTSAAFGTSVANSSGFFKNGVEIASSTLTFLARADINNAATVDFTAFNNSVYDSYLFTYQAVRPASDGVYLAFRTSSNGGSSYDSNPGDYTIFNTTYTEGYLSYYAMGNSAGEDGYYGNMTVYGAGISDRKTSLTAFGAYFFTDTTVEAESNYNMRNTAGVVNAIRFFMTSGNISSGIITMYGLRNA